MPEVIKNRRLIWTQRQLIGASVVLALILVGGGTSYLLYKTPDATSATARRSHVKAEGTLDTSDVIGLLPKLYYGDENVAFTETGASVYHANGHVYVTETSSDDMAAHLLLAAKRAHALAAMLYNQQINDMSGTWTAVDVIWTIVNQDGLPYASIRTSCEKDTDAGETLTDLLVGSTGYALADAAYEAIGGSALGLEQEYGNIPQKMPGKEIVPIRSDSTGDIYSVNDQ